MKHWLEHHVFLALRGVIRLLPPSAAFGLLETLALILHEGFGWRKHPVRERLRQVFPDMPESGRTRIRREAVRNLARNICELVRPDLEFEIRGREEAFAAVEKARANGKGVLLVIAHSGNWDAAGIQATRAGVPFCFIARKQKNHRLYRELIAARESDGGMVIERDDPKLIRSLLSFLSENGVVAILVDIRARQRGRPFRFLDQPAWLGNGLGLLASKSGAAVLPVFLGREDRHTHIWKPLPPQSLDPSLPLREARHELLQSCLDVLTPEILACPESYFWFNKRWVLEPFAETLTPSPPPPGDPD